MGLPLLSGNPVFGHGGVFLAVSFAWQHRSKVSVCETKRFGSSDDFHPTKIPRIRLLVSVPASQVSALIDGSFQLAS
jgi:hypothetical protein